MELRIIKFLPTHHPRTVGERPYRIENKISLNRDIYHLFRFLQRIPRSPGTTAENQLQGPVVA